MKYTILGLTGGIGSGKSTIMRTSKELGFKVLDADILARKAVEKEYAFYQVIDYFGPSILNSDQTINRKKLGQIVFNDPLKLAWLEQTIHPLITKMILKEIKKGPLPILYEAPLLLESGHDSLVDIIITVVAPEEERIKRIMARDSLTEEEARKRLSIQNTDQWRMSRSHVVINNDGTPEHLVEITKKLWADVIEGAPLKKIYE